MTPREQQIVDQLKKTFSSEDDVIEIMDTAGDQDHFRLTIISQQFEGQNRVNQQRMVFAALGDLAREVHAFEFRLSPK